MLLIARLLAIIAIIYLSFTLVFAIVKPVSNKRKKNTRDFLNQAKRQAKKEKFYYIRDVVLRRFTNRMLLGEMKRSEFKELIMRLDLKTTPEEIRAKQIVLALLALLAAILVIQLNPLIGYLSLLGPIIAWMYPVDDLEKKIEQKNKNIMFDFPSFYSMLYYQYSKSVHIYLADAVRDFLPNANPDMAEELGILIDNIEYGEEYALKQLKKRVPLRYIIKFCDIMQIRLNGYDNTSQMAYLKQELHDLRLQTLEDELKSREAKNIRTQFALILVLTVYVVIYFYYQFIDATRLFK
ncbi:hypothetical protein [Pseudobacteroides cellulosolvens]|uniref:Type II secretion system F domain-containing protein n=1 Tax=Pseudobacteroides cellulosolvens ATCC 35603 = DSM 2933 TaxID=398512 RepID=A0A0L6JP81_9FIRM|nr:hypothetical protein [Pseudobacteroides cellulosolvens]KNY27515.1 hypothetical protein Bccel_2786 [Pseudobacteroides cellulosolvens ATCC 35603 = DSM 2933]